MKIYFCDGCNESIPLADIQAGQTTTIKGKLFCRACIPLSSSRPAPAAAAESRGPGLGAILGGLLLLALLGWTVWRDWPLLTGAGEPSGSASEPSEVGQRLALLEDDVERLRAAGDDQRRQLDFRRADLDALQSAQDEQARAIDELRRETVRLARGQADMGQLIEQLNLLEARTDLLENRLDVIADRVVAHDRRFEMATSAGGPGAGSTTPAATAAAPGVDPTRAAELETLRRQLLDPDPGQRFDAVHRIGQGRYKELAPELVGVLDDEDPFVRERAMTVLGDFGHADAVPALLDALDDSLVTIRRTAGETLVRLTGHDPGYDPAASSSERDRAVTRWREWLAQR